MVFTIFRFLVDQIIKHKVLTCSFFISLVFSDWSNPRIARMTAQLEQPVSWSYRKKRNNQIDPCANILTDADKIPFSLYIFKVSSGLSDVLKDPYPNGMTYER